MEFIEQFNSLHEITIHLSFLGVNICDLQTKEPLTNLKGVLLGLVNIRNTNLIFKKLSDKFKINLEKLEIKYKPLSKEKEDTICNLLHEQYRQLQKIDTLLDKIGFEDYYIQKHNVKIGDVNINLSNKIVKRIKI